MPTLQIQSVAYRLIEAAHRLSSEAAAAVMMADHDQPGNWNIDCSPEVVQELWTWFDDCEQHSAILRRETWKVVVCQMAKERIARAM